MEGIAFDIAMANHDPEAFEAAARAVGFQGFGFYPRSGFVHIDLGPARSWGERFPKRATAFAAETPPAREVLAESRTLKGGGAAGVATVGAAGVEVAQQVLAETQGAVLPLVPYLDTLRWLFIAVALGGIAVAIYARLDDWKRGPAVIAGLSRGSGRAASRASRFGWACSSPSCSCSCCRSAVPASGSAGRWSASKLRREPLPFNAGCWSRRLVVLVIAASLPGGCGTARSDRPAGTVCSPIVDYGAELQVQAAAELQVLPEGSAIATLLGDYAVMRDQARACDAP